MKFIMKLIDEIDEIWFMQIFQLTRWLLLLHGEHFSVQATPELIPKPQQQ